MRRSIVLGCGSDLPAGVMTNDELATRIDTSDEWIRQRTGIHQRHIAAAGELTSDLALRAAQEALANAGVEPHEVDLLGIATETADNTFPATATRVKGRLGLDQGGAFEFQAGCRDVVYALARRDNKRRRA